MKPRHLLPAAALAIALALLLGSGDARGFGDGGRPYQLADMKMFNWVILNIKDNYLDQKRIDPREMLSASLNYVERMVPEVIITEAADKKAIMVQVGEHRQEFPVAEVGTIWEMAFKLKDIFTFVQGSLTGSTDVRDIEYAAINGMLSTLDPHSFFLKPESYKEIKTSTKGKFGGLGIQIQARDGYITIIAPIKDTPAWRAGLKKLDKIVRIDDESTANMNVDEAVTRLRGTPGTKVTIYIMREGLAEPKKFLITREEIKIATIESKLLPEGVAWIKLMQFTEFSAQDLLDHYGKLKDEHKGTLRGLVLDMRDNPGGLLESSIKISNYFYKTGGIVSTVAQEGKKVEERKAEESGFRIGVPVAILVSGGSASASEIVAGALKDNDRAIIIGQQTFGKGSVQVLYEKSIPPDDASKERRDAGLKLTVAQYLTPADISIQSVGITPDILLQPMRLEKDRVKLFFQDRPNKEKDLAKHLMDSRTREEKPALTLKYVADEKDPSLLDEEDPAADDEKNKDKDDGSKDKDEQKKKAKKDEKKDEEDKFVEDFPIRFARQVILATAAPTRMEMVKAAKGIAPRSAAQEDEKVAAGLGKIHLDWTAAATDPDGAPQVKARLSVERKDGKAIAQPLLTAGEEILLVLHAKNAGGAGVHRFSAVMESKDNLLDGKEFLIGSLPAGAEKSARVKVKVPKDYLSGVSEYTLKFHTGEKPVLDPIKGKIVIAELPRPRFVTTYKVSEAAGGNGAGGIEPGEAASIAVSVKNIGRGASQKPKVSLKNAGGKDVFIKQGRCELPPLPAGKSDACTLLVEVKKEMHEDRFPVVLSIFDSELGESTSEKIYIEVKGKDLTPPKNIAHAALSPLSGTLVAPDIKVGPVPNNIIVESTTVTIEGTVTDVSGLKDVYIKVNDKKVFYKAAVGTTTKVIGFKAALPLKDGINSVYVVARKTDDLMTVDKYIITRPQAPEKAPEKSPEAK